MCIDLKTEVVKWKKGYSVVTTQTFELLFLDCTSAYSVYLPLNLEKSWINLLIISVSNSCRSLFAKKSDVLGCTQVIVFFPRYLRH